MYGQKAKALKELNRKSVKIANTNYQYNEKLQENNVILHDRKHISEEIGKLMQIK